MFKLRLASSNVQIRRREKKAECWRGGGGCAAPKIEQGGTVICLTIARNLAPSAKFQRAQLADRTSARLNDSLTLAGRETADTRGEDS